ncbi:hypothetical protein [uncultured Tenacibaculum sp.]|uniref:hypothetical protein n=1 Tax=uncultured Tenacibaculum sp. TaxID=174713 RepID=UPI002601639F|nr:hypothetical protein [uncultured Tenacibaculum sp.]
MYSKKIFLFTILIILPVLAFCQKKEKFNILKIDSTDTSYLLKVKKIENSVKGVIIIPKSNNNLKEINKVKIYDNIKILVNEIDLNITKSDSLFSPDIEGKKIWKDSEYFSVFITKELKCNMQKIN